jgi:L-serine dehydratase
LTTSVFDLFKIGIGPSSSHTVGPMVAARRFALALERLLPDVAGIRVELYGSLGATGRGHGTEPAVLLGLQGEEPDRVDVDAIPAAVAGIRASGRIRLLGRQPAALAPDRDLVFSPRPLPLHPNGMRFVALDAAGEELAARVFYSVGGGFVVERGAAEDPRRPELPFPFRTAADLLAQCRGAGLAISDVMLQNERAWRPEPEVRAGLLRIWEVMRRCIERGCATAGTLPGPLRVPRRAPALARSIAVRRDAATDDPLSAMDRVNLWAIAVNEENAAGGRVVTAPTNGAAGIVPAVLHYYRLLVPGASEDGVVRFLLTAGAIGALYRENASISGAEVGCQGEVGSACSMAAGALAEVLGGTPEQVENAAEIGMEHNLGLTCDPIGGLVQIPCIERNAMGAVKAINAARIALRGDGRHFVSLDAVIRTMRETGADMRSKYKETALGGLAVHAAGGIPVNVPEC